MWAKSAGGTYYEGGAAVGSDAGGNAIVAGAFYSFSIHFGSITLFNSDSSISSDVFLAKYDPSGNVLWAKSFGGKKGEGVEDIYIDPLDNIYLVGNFASGVLSFGSDSLMNADGSGGIYQDIFIAKYDASGNFLWCRREGAAGSDYASGIVLDAAGNMYLSGSFHGPSISFGSSSLTNPGYSNTFLVKYDASGNPLWARSASGSYTDVDAGGLTIDPTGNVFIAGSFYSPSITFGSILMNNSSGSGGGYPDAFLVKYDGSGNVLWSKKAGGTDIDLGNSLSADVFGNVYICGDFGSNSLAFGSGINLSNSGPAGNYDMYMAKYNSAGIPQWAVKGGDALSSTSTSALSITTTSVGNILLAGYFEGSAVNFGSNVLSSGGFGDIFLAEYSPAAAILWIQSTGDTLSEIPGDLAIDGAGNVLMTGSYSSPGVMFGSTLLSSAGYTDFFLEKLDRVTGIPETEKENTFSIYPNPARGAFRISFPVSWDRLEVLNAFGQLVPAAVSSEGNVDLGTASGGIYFIRLFKEKKYVASGKLIRSR